MLCTLEADLNSLLQQASLPSGFWPASVNGTHAREEREKERGIRDSFSYFSPCGVPMSLSAGYLLDQGHCSGQTMFFHVLYTARLSPGCGGCSLSLSL